MTSEVQSRLSLRDGDVTAFLPRILQKDHISPDDCSLTAVYNKKDHSTRFTYSVSWNCDQPPAPSTLSSTCSDNSFQSVMNLESIERMVNAMPASQASSCVSTGFHCDGPCGRMCSRKNLTVLGRCNHYLCHDCTGLVMNSDGTLGCSTLACFHATHFPSYTLDQARAVWDKTVVVRCGKQRRERKHPCPSAAPAAATPRSLYTMPSSTTTESTHPLPSACSQSACVLPKQIFNDRLFNNNNSLYATSEQELLWVRLAVLTPTPGVIRREHMEKELVSTYSLRSALEALLPPNYSQPGHQCARLFYCPATRDNRMVMLKKEQLRALRLRDFDASNGVLHFVLDHTGTVKAR